MSIQTELTRLTDAKAAIKTAIEGKGVTVPSGTLLDGMASLIESIEAGGGLTHNSLYIAASGTFTVAERTEMSDENRFILQHNAGVIPLLVLITASKVSKTADFKNGIFFRNQTPTNPDSTVVCSLVTRKASTNFYENYKNEIGHVSSGKWTTEQVSLVSYNVTVYFNTDITYSWIAFYAD